MGVIQVKGWEQWEWLRHGFHTREGGYSDVYGAGELNVGLTREDNRETVLRNHGVLAHAIADKVEMRLVTVSQVHGAQIAPSGATERFKRRPMGS